MIVKFLTATLALFVLICSPKKQNIPSTDPTKIKYEWVIQDVDIPWGMAFLPDNSFLYTEKEGLIYHVKHGIKKEVGRPNEIYYRGQGGLLDICLDPDFETNNRIYLTMSRQPKGEKGGSTALVQAEFDGNSIQNYKVLYQALPLTSAGHHFGSRIIFDASGFLYFTIGDRGERDINPQNTQNDGGKVYRIHPDGTIPVDNPFENKMGGKSAVYSYGHRNPQGMTLNPITKEIWTHEHGPRGGDEINIIQKGANYGWPIITYGKEYSGGTITDQTSKEGMEQPLYYWIPSIAPSGMCFVHSNKYPEWEGNLLVGSLVFEYLERLELKNNQVITREKLLENLGRVRNVVQGHDGYIYVAIENKGILKITGIK
ncbi:MAG: PQQ-dependent sugar dehydrogenase [Saprospiraceae bacterium]